MTLTREQVEAVLKCALGGAVCERCLLTPDECGTSEADAYQQLLALMDRVEELERGKK